MNNNVELNFYLILYIGVLITYLTYKYPKVIYNV